ncbi:hypothetical protein HMPREF0972_01149 [Actinomyces sp. oral taxon 848 str. F0332]|nr:hypothetical protein HMPREF0972_01149 [Actinomyces sp. oral taxon 848 str. F0332]
MSRKRSIACPRRGSIFYEAAFQTASPRQPSSNGFRQIDITRK